MRASSAGSTPDTPLVVFRNLLCIIVQRRIGLRRKKDFRAIFSGVGVGQGRDWPGSALAGVGVGQGRDWPGSGLARGGVGRGRRWTGSALDGVGVGRGRRWTGSGLARGGVGQGRRWTGVGVGRGRRWTGSGLARGGVGQTWGWSGSAVRQAPVRQALRDTLVARDANEPRLTRRSHAPLLPWPHATALSFFFFFAFASSQKHCLSLLRLRKSAVFCAEGRRPDSAEERCR